MPASDYTIDRNEHLRYLGYSGQELSEAFCGKLDEAASRCLRVAEPKSFYRIFDVSENASGVELQGTVTSLGTGVTLLGEDIRNHMRGAVRCAVLGATLGLGIDRELQRLQVAGMTDALLLNAACTVLIEQVTDRCEAEIVRRAGEVGFVTGFRFSPGYGDFPLSQQPEILAMLDGERRLGIRLTEGFLMLPKKSVTAVVPFFPHGTVVRRTRTCADCSNRDACEFRKAGVNCGGTISVGE